MLRFFPLKPITVSVKGAITDTILLSLYIIVYDFMPIEIFFGIAFATSSTTTISFQPCSVVA